MRAFNLSPRTSLEVMIHGRSMNMVVCVCRSDQLAGPSPHNDLPKGFACHGASFGTTRWEPECVSRARHPATPHMDWANWAFSRQMLRPSVYVEVDYLSWWIRHPALLVSQGNDCFPPGWRGGRRVAESEGARAQTWHPGRSAKEEVRWINQGNTWWTTDRSLMLFWPSYSIFRSAVPDNYRIHVLNNGSVTV